MYLRSRQSLEAVGESCRRRYVSLRYPNRASAIAMTTPDLLDHFAALEDPRQSWKTLCPLDEILLIVLAGVMAAADDFVEISLRDRRRLAWLRRFLPLNHGVPSHDSRGDLMTALANDLFGPMRRDLGGRFARGGRRYRGDGRQDLAPRAWGGWPPAASRLDLKRRGNGWGWGRRAAPRKRMKSAPYPACWSGWSCAARW